MPAWQAGGPAAGYQACYKSHWARVFPPRDALLLFPSRKVHPSGFAFFLTNQGDLLDSINGDLFDGPGGGDIGNRH